MRVSGLGCGGKPKLRGKLCEKFVELLFRIFSIFGPSDHNDIDLYNGITRVWII